MAIQIVARLHRVMANIVERGDADEVWLAESLRLHIQHGADLDDTLGLAPGWRGYVRHRRQVELLRVILDTLPALSGRAAARTVHRRLMDYATTRWTADHAAGRRPSGARGYLFDFLAAGGPTSEERIRKLLPEAWAMNDKDMTQRAA